MHIRGDAMQLSDVEELHNAAQAFIEKLIETNDKLKERVAELEDEAEGLKNTIAELTENQGPSHEQVQSDTGAGL